MPFDIESMKSALVGGGDRASKFEVRMTLPTVAAGDSGASEMMTFMCKAASAPPMILGVVNVAYFGRTFKVAGDREFPEWPVTITNDENHLVRRVMEQWSHRINTVRKNVTVAPFSANPNTYKTDAYVYKYGKEGNILRIYKFVGIWPTVVEPIEYNWEDKDRITEFRVQFAYDYWENDTDILGSEGSAQIVL